MLSVLVLFLLAGMTTVAVAQEDERDPPQERLMTKTGTTEEFGGGDYVLIDFGKDAKFVRRYGDLHNDAVASLRRFFGDVQRGAFPGDEQTYHMPDDALTALLEEEPQSGE